MEVARVTMTRSGRDLIEDRLISWPQPVAERRRGRPSEQLPDQGVVAVAAADALRGIATVDAAQLDSRNLFDDVHELIDRHRFIASEIERFVDVALHDAERALDTIVDVHEAPALPAVTPDLDLPRL